MRDFAELQAAAICGELQDWCCMPVETFLRYREDLGSLSDERIRALHKLACKCASRGAPPAPGSMEDCEAQLKAVSCSSTGISLLKGLDVVLTPMVDIPGVGAPAGTKDLRDAARAIVVVFEKKEPVTTQHITALCTAYEKAKSSIGSIPGGTYAYDRIKSSSLGQALEACCKARYSPPAPGGQQPPGGGPPPPATPPTEQRSTVAQIAPMAGSVAAAAAFGPAAAPLGYAAGTVAGSVIDGMF